MRTVRIDKANLTGKVQYNRDRHREVFERAIEGWRQAVVELLSEMVDRAKAGDNVDLTIRLPRPQDHTDDYDRILMMLEFSLDESIELTEQEFAWYVQDEWGWKQQWTTTNSSYVA